MTALLDLLVLVALLYFVDAVIDLTRREKDSSLVIKFVWMLVCAVFVKFFICFLVWLVTLFFER